MNMEQINTIPSEERLRTVDRDQPKATPMALIQIALERDLDMDKLQRLIDMQREYEARDAVKAFNNALVDAQQEIQRVAPDCKNDQTKSRYASYAALDRAIRPVYVKHGFSLSFNTDDAEEGWVWVTCEVAHRSGHSKTYKAKMPNDGKGARGNDVMTRTHAQGSAVAYGMRYLLKMIFNVAVGEEDTDGNSNDYLADVKDEIFRCKSEEELKAAFARIFADARANHPKQLSDVCNIKDQRSAQLKAQS